MHSQLMFNECIARTRVLFHSDQQNWPLWNDPSSTMSPLNVISTYFPAADSEKESKHVGLLLLLELLDILESTHLCCLTIEKLACSLKVEYLFQGEGVEETNQLREIFAATVNCGFGGSPGVEFWRCAGQALEFCSCALKPRDVWRINFPESRRGAISHTNALTSSGPTTVPEF